MHRPLRRLNVFERLKSFGRTNVCALRFACCGAGFHSAAEQKGIAASLQERLTESQAEREVQVEAVRARAQVEVSAEQAEAHQARARAEDLHEQLASTTEKGRLDPGFSRGGWERSEPPRAH